MAAGAAPDPLLQGNHARDQHRQALRARFLKADECSDEAEDGAGAVGAAGLLPEAFKDDQDYAAVRKDGVRRELLGVPLVHA